MSLQDEIKPFIDGNLLVAPNLVPSGVLKGSDNGPMFTSELVVMLDKLNQLRQPGVNLYEKKINNCINSECMLNRVPTSQQDGQEGPDDYYGVLNATKRLNLTGIPRGFLWAVIKYAGALNNVRPGNWTDQSFLIRQPQLLCAMITAAFPSKLNPLHWCIRILIHPLYLYTAVVILLSCINTPKDQADPRRLAWHLIQTVKGVSFLCWLASKVWYRRLYKTYGPDGMKAVAAYYYKDNHPFIKYWVTE